MRSQAVVVGLAARSGGPSDVLVLRAWLWCRLWCRSDMQTQAKAGVVNAGRESKPLAVPTDGCRTEKFWKKKE